MLDYLRAIAVFAKTVELGSFRGAARALGLSPSVVSHHITQLEAALDVALLYRTTRRLALTDSGRQLFEAARDMVAAAERGLGLVSSDAENPAGTLRIAAPASLLSDVLYADLAAFCAAFPRVTVAMQLSDVQIDIIGHGIDVAFRAGSMKDSTMRSRKLFDFERTLIAAPSYLAKRPTFRRPRDLASCEWLQLSSRPPTATFVRGDRRQTIAFSSRITVDSAAALLYLARHGAGVAMVPAEMANPELAAGRLVEVLPGWRLESLAVHAVLPANASKSGLARRLVEFLDGRRPRAEPSPRSRRAT